MIKKNLMIGNFQGAIDASMKCGRTVEALLLAYSQSEELFKETMKQFFQTRKDAFVKNILRNLVEDQLQDLVNTYDLNQWNELVILLISNAKGDQRVQLFGSLAERFASQNMREQEILMRILSGNHEAVFASF